MKNSNELENLIKLADKELNLGDWKKALEYCEKVFLIEPENKDILKIYEQALIKNAKDLVEFVKSLEKEYYDIQSMSNIYSPARWYNVYADMDINYGRTTHVIRGQSHQQSISKLNELKIKINDNLKKADLLFDKVLSINDKNPDAIFGKLEVFLHKIDVKDKSEISKTKKMVFSKCNEILQEHPDYEPAKQIINTIFSCNKCNGSGVIHTFFGKEKVCPICDGKKIVI